MKKFAIKPEFSLRLLDRKRLWFGLFAGLLLAFSFYLFWQFFKESFLLFSRDRFTESTDLSDKLYYFLTFFIAFISVMLGSNIMFEIWFNEPKFPFKRRISRNPQLLAEARTFIWYFIFWAASMALSLVFYINGTYPYCFNYLTDYLYIFILLMLVLYLSLWTSFIHRFKSAWKFQIIHLVATLLLSGIFSLYIPASIRRMDIIREKNQISTNYILNVPKAGLLHFDRIEKLSLLFDIYIAKPKDSTDNKISFVMGNKELSVDQLGSAINMEVQSHDKADRKFLTARLFVDADIQMKYLSIIKSKLRKEVVNKVFYVVKDSSGSCFQPIGERGIYHRVPFPVKTTIYYNKHPELRPEPEHPPISPFFFERIKNQIKTDSILLLEIKDSLRFVLNSQQGNINELSAALKKYWKPKYHINLSINDSMTYETYIRVLGILNNFIYEYRDFYSNAYYQTNFYTIYEREKYRNIMNIVPCFYELDADEISLIRSQTP